MTPQPLNRPCGVDVLSVLDREIAAIKNTKEMVDFSMSADRQAAYSDHLSSLTQARADVAGLIEAMRPFAELAELFDDEMRGGNMPKADTDPIMQWPRIHKEYELRVGHLRNARTAIAAVEGQS